MTAYYSMIYVLLSAKYPLIDLSSSDEPLELCMPKLYNGTLEQNIIYVVSDIGTFVPPDTAGDYVLLFYETDALGIKLPPGSRSILIGGCHDPISAFEALVEIFMRLERWETEFFRLTQSDSPVSRMLELFYTLIPQRLIFEDENYKHMYEFPAYDAPPSDLSIKYATDRSASPTNPEDASYQQFSSAIKAAEIYSTQLCPKVRVLRIEASQSVVISRRLYEADRLIGRVQVKYEESTHNINLMDGYCHLVNTLGEHLESKLIIALKGSISQGDDALHNAFNDLIFSSDTIVPRDVLGFLSELGWSRYDKYLVSALNIDMKSMFAEVSGYLCGYFEKIWPNCIALRKDNRIILFFNISHSSEMRVENIVEQLSTIRDDIVYSVAFSNYFHNVLSAADYYIQCDYLLKHKKIRNSDEWIFIYNKYSMDYIADHLIKRYSVEYICHPGVLALYKYDKDNSSELTLTLYHYVKCHLNTSEAAKAISIHRTTFIKRLEKIFKIAEFDVDSSDEILHILLSLKLLGVK